MNLASPCGPPSRLKTNCDFSPNAAVTFARTENGGRSAAQNVDPGVDRQQTRRFPVNPGLVRFLFISRCGGSLIRLPWRLPRYTLAYRPSNGKICQLPRVRLRRLAWLRAESRRGKKTAFVAVKTVSLIEAACASVFRRPGNGWSVRRECDNTGFLFLFLPHRSQARCLCRCARFLRRFRKGLHGSLDRHWREVHAADVTREREWRSCERAHDESGVANLANRSGHLSEMGVDRSALANGGKAFEHHMA